MMCVFVCSHTHAYKGWYRYGWTWVFTYVCMQVWMSKISFTY